MRTKLIILIALFFVSCSDLHLFNFTYNWTFETRYTIDYSPELNGFPKTINIISYSKNLTNSEAEKLASQKNTFQQTDSAGYKKFEYKVCTKYMDDAYLKDTTIQTIYQ